MSLETLRQPDETVDIRHAWVGNSIAVKNHIEATFERGAGFPPTRLRLDGEEYPVDWVREVRPAAQEEGPAGWLVVRLRGYSQELDKTMNIGLTLPARADDPLQPAWGTLDGLTMLANEEQLAPETVAALPVADRPHPAADPALGERAAKSSGGRSKRPDLPVGLPGWRRAPCLACGLVVIRHRHAHCIIGGTRSGSWAVAWPTKPGRAASTGPVPEGETAFLLGACHRGCLADAMISVRAGRARLDGPVAMLTVDEVEGEYALHLPGTDNACLFCESHGPMTEEHVWAKWISRELASRGRNFAPRPGERRPLQEIDYTARVCKECNTGWMSVLENDIKTVMSSMLYGDFVVLSPADQDLLAMWALKTAFMIDRLNESVVPRGYPMGLAIERRPPDNCVVLLGAFDGNIAAGDGKSPARWETYHWGARRPDGHLHGAQIGIPGCDAFYSGRNAAIR